VRAKNGRATRQIPRWRAWLWLTVVITVLLLSVITARALLSARHEWEGGQRALKDGRASLAITFFRRSAGWHVPFSPYTARALEMLDFLARRESQKGRAEAARVATRAKTAAQNSVRNITTRLPSDPNPLFSLLALAGWLVWSFSALILVTRGLDAESQISEDAPKAMLAIVLGMAVFALGLALA
jgi:hypothetical protein